MAVQTVGFQRQPSKLDYAAQTQFRFMINYLPLTEYFVQTVNLSLIHI